MKFLKNNSYDIVKLYINQIGISIFSMFLYFAINAVTWSNQQNQLTLTVTLSVFSMLFYYVLIYSASWDMGSSDAIRIESGRIEKKPIKGLFLGLFANLLNFLFAGFSILFSSLIMAGYELRVLFGVLNIPLRFATALYNGLLQGVFQSYVSNETLYFLLQSIGFMVLPIVSVLICFVGYYCGMENKRILKPSKKEEELKRR